MKKRQGQASALVLGGTGHYGPQIVKSLLDTFDYAPTTLEMEVEG